METKPVKLLVALVILQMGMLLNTAHHVIALVMLVQIMEMLEIEQTVLHVLVLILINLIYFALLNVRMATLDQIRKIRVNYAKVHAKHVHLMPQNVTLVFQAQVLLTFLIINALKNVLKDMLQMAMFVKNVNLLAKLVNKE